jgi:hypothetical protein
VLRVDIGNGGNEGRRGLMNIGGRGRKQKKRE